MFRTVIVGVNEHPGASDAIALAKQLIAEDGELTLANVYVFHADPRVTPGYTTDYGTDDQNHARTLLESANQEAGGLAQERWTGSTSVGRGLHELAESLGADLLVVGSSRPGRLGRVLLGDDTQAALDGAPSAVAIAPAGYAQQASAMQSIGVGFDGSAESDRALAAARSLAAKLGAKLTVFEAVDVHYDGWTGPVITGRAEIARLVEEARERISALGGVEAHAAYGDPAEELGLWGASQDLLIVGSRGYGPVGRLVHGSTSRALARSARCPLLVLPRGARDALASDAERRRSQAVNTA